MHQRKGVKRSSGVFSIEEGDGAEQGKVRTKITILESKSMEASESTEEKLFQIPPPSSSSFLLKAIKKKDRQEPISNQIGTGEGKQIPEWCKEEVGSLEKRAKDWLKTQGWREGEAVGRNSKGRPVSPVLILNSRPQFLGLGAQLSPDTAHSENLPATDEDCESFLSDVKIGMLIKTMKDVKGEVMRGIVMDVLEEVIIMKCGKDLLNLQKGNLFPIFPDQVGQRVYILSRRMYGTVHFLDPPQCVIQEDEEQSFITTGLSDCCCIQQLTEVSEYSNL